MFRQMLTRMADQVAVVRLHSLRANRTQHGASENPRKKKNAGSTKGRAKAAVKLNVNGTLASSTVKTQCEKLGMRKIKRAGVRVVQRWGR